ncbi:MAG: hypothetical protein FWC73_14105 [Defluviitaleaceae bacterium]|nr:hypothetical protein [Defluviitaleaceae bacterium]
MASCPVCNKYNFEEDFDLCPICLWQHDRIQENEPHFAGGANDLSLNQFRAEWLRQNAISVSKKTAYQPA